MSYLRNGWATFWDDFFIAYGMLGLIVLAVLAAFTVRAVPCGTMVSPAGKSVTSLCLTVVR